MPLPDSTLLDMIVSSAMAQRRAHPSAQPLDLGWILIPALFAVAFFLLFLYRLHLKDLKNKVISDGRPDQRFTNIFQIIFGDVGGMIPVKIRNQSDPYRQMLIDRYNRRLNRYETMLALVSIVGVLVIIIRLLASADDDIDLDNADWPDSSGDSTQRKKKENIRP